MTSENASGNSIDNLGNERPASGIKAAPHIVKVVLWVASLILCLPLVMVKVSVQTVIFFLMALVLFPPLTAYFVKVTGRAVGYGPKIVVLVILLGIASRYPDERETRLIEGDKKSGEAPSLQASTEWKDSGHTGNDSAFSFGVEDYVAWVNKNLAETELPLLKNLKKTSVSDGFLHQGMLNEHLGWLISEDQSGKVSSVMFIGQGDGTMKSGADLMLATIAAVRAANQTASIDNQLGRLALDLIKAEQELVTHNGIEYKPVRDKNIGFMLTISPMDK